MFWQSNRKYNQYTNFTATNSRTIKKAKTSVTHPSNRIFFPKPHSNRREKAPQGVAGTRKEFLVAQATNPCFDTWETCDSISRFVVVVVGLRLNHTHSLAVKQVGTKSGTAGCRWTTATGRLKIKVTVTHSGDIFRSTIFFSPSKVKLLDLIDVIPSLMESGENF